MHLISIDASPKQLSKLRNGHKVRIKKGTGFNLIVSPSTYHRVSRTFTKSKGADIALSPEEIDANKMYSPERHTEIKTEMEKAGLEAPMEGSGIFRKAGRWLKKAGKKLAGPVAAKLVEQGLKYAVPAVATAVFGPGAAPVAGVVGNVAAKEASKATEKAVSKQVGSGIRHRVPKSLAHAGIGTYEADKALAKLSDEQFGRRHHIAPYESYYDEPLGPRSRGTGAHRGRGLYAGGSGLYAGGSGLYASARARGRGLFAGGAVAEEASIGRNGGFVRQLPPALQSQPYSANFHFQFQLPPQYQQFEQGPAVEY